MPDHSSADGSEDLRKEMYYDSHDSRQFGRREKQEGVAVQKKVKLMNDPRYLSLVNVTEDSNSDASSDPFASSQHSGEPRSLPKRKLERSLSEQRGSALLKDEGLATWKLFPDQASQQRRGAIGLHKT